MGVAVNQNCRDAAGNKGIREESQKKDEELQALQQGFQQELRKKDKQI